MWQLHDNQTMSHDTLRFFWSGEFSLVWRCHLVEPSPKAHHNNVRVNSSKSLSVYLGQNWEEFQQEVETVPSGKEDAMNSRDLLGMPLRSSINGSLKTDSDDSNLNTLMATRLHQWDTFNPILVVFFFFYQK